MAAGKIQVKLGTIEFIGEGDEAWLANQLDKLFEKAPNLLKLAPVMTGSNGFEGSVPIEIEYGEELKNTPLATFLKNKNVGGNQVVRFLATAIWLTKRGSIMLTTADISKALRENHQPKITNPSDTLNKNVGKGFCEKQGSQFFVTPDGLASLN
jgi:hypothetical protein